jgi:hypothetical protein
MSRFKRHYGNDSDNASPLLPGVLLLVLLVLIFVLKSCEKFDMPSEKKESTCFPGK